MSHDTSFAASFETHTPEVTRSVAELKQIASQGRRDILRMVHAINFAHPGGSLGCTNLLVALYFKVMQHTPEPFDLNGVRQDLFFLSNGHISPVFYSALARIGLFPGR